MVALSLMVFIALFPYLENQQTFKSSVYRLFCVSESSVGEMATVPGQVSPADSI